MLDWNRSIEMGPTLHLHGMSAVGKLRRIDMIRSQREVERHSLHRHNLLKIVKRGNSHHRGSAIVFAAICLATLIPTGCTDTPIRSGVLSTDLHSADPLVRGESALAAGRNKDQSVIPDLIELLDDEEYGVRLNAHMALNVIIGPKDFGYRAFDTKRERNRASQRYRDWYAEQVASGSL